MNRGDDGSRSLIVYIAVIAILLWGVWSKGDIEVFLGLDNEPSDYGEKSMTLAEAMYYELGPKDYKKVYDALGVQKAESVRIDMEDMAEAICEDEGRRLDLETFECVDSKWW